MTYFYVDSRYGTDSDYRKNLDPYSYKALQAVLSMVAHYPDGATIYWGAEPYAVREPFFGFSALKITGSLVSLCKHHGTHIETIQPNQLKDHFHK